MEQPVLVVMAAGMGSRYGGLKQIDPVDKEGHIIMDFSVYDAVKAGFKKVIFIIKKENEADFKAAIGDRLSKHLDVTYVFQDLKNLPEGYEVPEGRVKPWGTGHAVLSCIDEIDGPFAVINADDYYGANAFRMAYDFLTQNQDEDGIWCRNAAVQAKRRVWDCRAVYGGTVRLPAYERYRRRMEYEKAEPDVEEMTEIEADPGTLVETETAPVENLPLPFWRRWIHYGLTISVSLLLLLLAWLGFRQLRRMAREKNER